MPNKINYKKELNPEQFTVVENANGPCLVLAGAGSGKTRTLVYRVAYLLEQGVHPGSIMLLTFTNKASREMLDRVQDISGVPFSGLYGGTFHHMANRFLRKYGNALGYDRNFNIMDMDDSKALIKICRDECGVDKTDKYFPKPDVITKIISFSQNSCLSVEDVIEDRFSHLMPYVVDQIKMIASLYKERKKTMNAMDFDDLLLNWMLLLKDIPSLAKKISSQFEYLLVDEYQDTNKIQSQLIKLLCKEHNNILVVGDDAQSIYSFRAATVANILEFEKDYKGAKIYKLETNYRSLPGILDLANQSISFNPLQYEKNLKTHEANQGDDYKPKLVPVNNNYQQADFICRKIEKLQEEDMKLSDMAVLFRSSFHIIELELELNRRGIPYVVRGGLRFFEQAHVKDVLAYLRVFNNHKDEVSWKRILQLYPGIGPAAASKVWNSVKGLPDITAVCEALFTLELNPKIKKSILKVSSVLREMSMSEKDVADAGIKIVLEKSYDDYVRAKFENFKERLADLEQLGIFSLQYENLDAFLSEVSLSESFKGSRKQARAEDEKDSLVLTTIHQAKGLEWNTVFIMSLADGVFPHYKVFDNPKELAEERRLFYVAVTRAKKELYCLFPMSSNMGDRIQKNNPSLFLTEVDEDLFEVVDLPGVMCDRFSNNPFGDFEETESHEDSEDSGGGILDKIIRGNKDKYKSLNNSVDEDGFYEEETIEY